MSAAGSGPGGRPDPGGWNRFHLEEFLAPLREAGARFRGNRVEGQGGAQILVEDPSGNVVELFERKAA